MSALLLVGSTSKATLASRNSAAKGMAAAAHEDTAALAMALSCLEHRLPPAEGVCLVLREHVVIESAVQNLVGEAQRGLLAGSPEPQAPLLPPVLDFLWNQSPR